MHWLSSEQLMEMQLNGLHRISIIHQDQYGFFGLKVDVRKLFLASSPVFKIIFHSE